MHSGYGQGPALVKRSGFSHSGGSLHITSRCGLNLIFQETQGIRFQTRDYQSPQVLSNAISQPFIHPAGRAGPP